MLKKSLTLCLALLMLLSALPFNAGAASNDLIFDLDLTGTTESSIAVANSAGATSTVTWAPTVTSGMINSTPYVTFQKDTASAAAYIKAEDANFEGLDNMTAEFWLNAENTGYWKEIFKLTTGESESKYTYNLVLSDKSIYFRPDGQNVKGIYNLSDNYLSKWIHVAVTRSWDAAPGSTGTVKSTLYINGEEMTSVSDSKTRRSEAGQYLILGRTADNGSQNAFMGSIADFKLYNYELKADDIESHYQEEQVNFITYPDTMEIESISKPITTDPDVPELIAQKSDAITVCFDNYIDASTVQEGIKFLKANGDEIPGGSYATVPSAFSKEATVKYGKLELGETYKLVVTDALKSLNNISATPAEYYYEAASNTLYSINFTDEDDYVVNAEPPVQDGFTYYSKGVSGSTENVTVKQENGVKFLSITDGGVTSKDNLIFWNPDEPITSAIVNVDVKIRPYAEDGNYVEIPCELMRIYSKNNKGNTVYQSLARAYTGFTIMARSDTDASNTQIGFEASGYTGSFQTKGRDGFYNLRFTFIKEGDYYKTATITNLNGPEEGTTTLTFLTDISEITQLRLAHFYPTGNETGWLENNQSVQLAGLTITETSSPVVLHADVADMSRNDDSFDVVFSEELLSSSITDETFVLKDEKGRVIPTVLSEFDQEARKATIQIKQFLKENMNYTLEIGSVRTIEDNVLDVTDYSFKAQAAKVMSSTYGFTDENDDSVSAFAEDSVVKIKYSITNNSDVAVTCRAVLVIYDENNRVEKVIMGESKPISAKGGKDSVEALTTDVALTTAQKIKAFVWNEDEVSGALALADPMTLEKAQN